MIGKVATLLSSRVTWTTPPSPPSSGWIDVRVAVILEHPEEPVEAHVDARRLHHGLVVGLEHDAPAVDLGADVTVTQKHGPTLGADPRRPAQPHHHKSGPATLPRDTA